STSYSLLRLCVLFLSRYAHHPDLHSFPTRRSSDLPLGLYDLQVTNPNGAVSVIPYRFMIEPARPLDVSIGLGGPDELLLSKSGFPNAYYGVSLTSRPNIDTPYVVLPYVVTRPDIHTFIP